MNIKQSEINTFNRVGIPYQKLLEYDGIDIAFNRFTGDSVVTTPFINYLVKWVYKTSNDYENGKTDIRISDFDRVRYFILREASDVYSTCID